MDFLMARLINLGQVSVIFNDPNHFSIVFSIVIGQKCSDNGAQFSCIEVMGYDSKYFKLWERDYYKQYFAPSISYARNK